MVDEAPAGAMDRDLGDAVRHGGGQRPQPDLAPDAQQPLQAGRLGGGDP